MLSSQVYIDIIGNVTPNLLVLNTRRSDYKLFDIFPSKHNSETKQRFYIVITGEFSLIKISI